VLVCSNKDANEMRHRDIQKNGIIRRIEEHTVVYRADTLKYYTVPKHSSFHH